MMGAGIALAGMSLASAYMLVNNVEISGWWWCAFILILLFGEDKK